MVIKSAPPNTELIELGNRFDSKRAALIKKWDESIDPQTKVSKLTGAEKEAFDKEMAEVNDLGAMYELQSKAWQDECAKKGLSVNGMPALNQRAAEGLEGDAIELANGKSIGDIVFSKSSTKDEQRKSGYRNFNSHPVEVELTGIEFKDLPRAQIGERQGKTLMTDFGANGYAPFIQRTGEVVYQPTGQIILQDFMPQDTTDQASIKYMFENVYDNEAAARAEGAVYAEGGLSYIEVVSQIVSVATIIPVTEEQLEDVPQLQAIINNRMGTMVRQKMQELMLNGTGSSPQITGFLNASGLLTSNAVAGDPIISILNGITLVNSNSYNNAESAHCNAVAINPKDLLKIRSMKNNIGDYILGNPSQPLFNERIWGLGIAETEKETQGTMLVGDFAMFSHLWTRKGLTIEIGYSGTDFAQGRKSIRANTRFALQISRSNAFCKIPGN